MKYALVAVQAWLVCSALAATPIVREEGVIYPDDFSDQPMRLKVLKPAPAYFDRGLTRYVGTLRVPQQVQVQAISENHIRIKGNAQQGQILGWVEAAALEPIPPKVLDDLRVAEERRVKVNALIARNEVALGMTLDEVLRSIGKPQKRTNRASKEGEEEIWEYIKYKLVPQQQAATDSQGRSIIVTNYVKVAVGRLAVGFKDGLVDRLDQTEGADLGAAQLSVVAPPVIVY